MGTENDIIENLKRVFSELVRQRRNEVNLTQELLAEILSISVVYLRKIERGECIPSWIIWLMICTVLEIDIGEIRRKYITPIIAEHKAILNLEPRASNLSRQKQETVKN